MPWFVTAGFWTQYDQDSIVMNKLCVIIHNTVYGFPREHKICFMIIHMTMHEISQTNKFGLSEDDDTSQLCMSRS